MAHVEELRQIHADINAMETIIKQAEESRRALQVRISLFLILRITGINEFVLLKSLLWKKTY